MQEKISRAPEVLKIAGLRYTKGLWSRSKSCHQWELASEWEGDGPYWVLVDLYHVLLPIAQETERLKRSLRWLRVEGSHTAVSLGQTSTCLGPGKDTSAASRECELSGNLCGVRVSVYLGVLLTSQRLAPWFQQPAQGMMGTTVPLHLTQAVRSP